MHGSLATPPFSRSAVRVIAGTPDTPGEDPMAVAFGVDVGHPVEPRAGVPSLK
jgi:hypothetical protein